VLGAMGEGEGFLVLVVSLGTDEAEVAVAHGVEGTGGSTNVGRFGGFDEDEGILAHGISGIVETVINLANFSPAFTLQLIHT
jgi:hypothetical protein